jgi:hypothetical protein
MKIYNNIPNKTGKLNKCNISIQILTVFLTAVNICSFCVNLQEHVGAGLVPAQNIK